MSSFFLKHVTSSTTLRAKTNYFHTTTKTYSATNSAFHTAQSCSNNGTEFQTVKLARNLCFCSIFSTEAGKKFLNARETSSKDG